MRSAAPQKLISGNAFRKSVMNDLISSRPRRGACREYCRSIFGAASSSTILRLQVVPQKSVNQRPTIALLSCSLVIVNSFCDGDRHTKLDRFFHLKVTHAPSQRHSVSCCKSEIQCESLAGPRGARIPPELSQSI